MYCAKIEWLISVQWTNESHGKLNQKASTPCLQNKKIAIISVGHSYQSYGLMKTNVIVKLDRRPPAISHSAALGNSDHQNKN